MPVNFAVPADNSEIVGAEGGMGRVATYFVGVRACLEMYQDGRRPVTPPPAAYKCSYITI